MVAAPLPPNFREDLKISDQNNWGRGEGVGGPQQKIKFGEGAAMNPNDVMVVVLKDILLC